ncbi:biopolymer transport protein ExbB [Rhizobiales bacterium GAS113]|jgi:biopolymer transport protein ExbB|nr:biopolymer transport protein ExbB [Rhizobiales bacterium GAS113]
MTHDLTPWGMFLGADIVVKLVMLGLAFASLVTWTVWLAKSLELVAAKRAARRALATLLSASSLKIAAQSPSGERAPVAQFLGATLAELEASAGLPAEGIKERVATSLSRNEARAGRSMMRGTGVLATIGATAPFVGLFGTVWGIMNSFIGISKSNTTNLAVVAPGIAEALLATALGLVAAIPAVMIYNVFARAIAGYKALLADAAAEIMRHVSRDLDRQILDRQVLDPQAFGAAETEGRVVAMRRQAE